MKEWDQNDLGKGAKINFSAIQQSVKRKAFPEAAIYPLAVTSNPSCFRRAPRKMSKQVMCCRSVFIKHTQNSWWERRMSHWASSSEPLMVSFIYPSWANFSTSLVGPPKQTVLHQPMGRQPHHQCTFQGELGSLEAHTFPIPGSACVTNDGLGWRLLFLCFLWLERNCVSLMLTAWWMWTI